MASQAMAQDKAAPRTRRRDAWWLLPVVVVTVLSGFILYTTWAGLNNNNFYAHGYLSPFYSPCLAENCGGGATWKILGSWWTLSPAILILALPAGFRLTCYYYRKAYYRSFFGAPPACAVMDTPKNYKGETRFPFILQNVHRYFFYFATIVLGFLWYDAIDAARYWGWEFHFGTLIMFVNVILLSGYSLSCHSFRYISGGNLDRFFKAPIRYKTWRFVSRLNARHANFAWFSLFSVALTDLYIRLVASGTISGRFV
jgi:hypothetical protein